MTGSSAFPPATSRILTLLVALTTFGFGLGIIAAGDNTLAWDLSFARWIQRWYGATGETLYRIGDILGTTSLAAGFTVVGFLVAWLVKKLQIAIFLFLVMTFRLAGTLLKPLFDSPRPNVDQLRMLETFEGTGYPSGHSMTVAMVATMITLLAWRYMPDSRSRWGLTMLATAAVLLVGWSRIWSGAHWPSDVLGGWSFGIALVLIAWISSDRMALLPIFRRDTTAGTATN